MINGVIRLGDRLSQGGSVTGASGEAFAGKPVMLQGDPALCAQHGPTAAAQGHPAWTMNGRGVVVDKTPALCGCLFLTSLPDAGVCL